MRPQSATSLVHVVAPARVLAGVCAWLGFAAHAAAQPPPPPAPPPQAQVPGPAPAPSTDADAARGRESPLPTPLATALPPPPSPNAPLPCPAGSVAASVADTAPIRRCPVLPLETTCRDADGRSHGPAVVWSVEHACKIAQRSETWHQGRRQGAAVVWRADCPAPPRPEPGADCVARVAERGPMDDGRRHGVWETYDGTGKLAEVGPYVRGRRHGRWLRWQLGKPSEVLCYARDTPTWQTAADDPEAGRRPCAAADDAGDGTESVSEAQREASRYAALAQRSARPELKVRYLRRAVELDPGNDGYRRLLEHAEKAARDAQAPPGAPGTAAPGGTPPGR